MLLLDSFEALFLGGWYTCVEMFIFCMKGKLINHACPSMFQYDFFLIASSWCSRACLFNTSISKSNGCSGRERVDDYSRSAVVAKQPKVAQLSSFLRMIFLVTSFFSQ